MEMFLHDVIFAVASLFAYLPDYVEVTIIPGELYFRGDGGATTGPTINAILYGKE